MVTPDVAGECGRPSGLTTLRCPGGEIDHYFTYSGLREQGRYILRR